ncbi:hypothetical protein D7X75_36715 [Corallococcus sp. CA031C]|nr:hypothetical protein D7X75_36715 [Corallococcus sp. CA031C]
MRARSWWWRAGWAGRTQFARLVGTAVAADGMLLVADDANGVIYRIRYAGWTSPAAIFEFTKSATRAGRLPVRIPPGPGPAFVRP